MRLDCYLHGCRYIGNLHDNLEGEPAQRMVSPAAAGLAAGPCLLYQVDNSRAIFSRRISYTVRLWLDKLPIEVRNDRIIA
jgi:hypothetical protein